MSRRDEIIGWRSTKCIEGEKHKMSGEQCNNYHDCG